MGIRFWRAGVLAVLALNATGLAQTCSPTTRAYFWDLTAAPPTQSGVYADARFGISGSTAYFVGYDAATGSRRIWQTDGTPGGTQAYSPLGLGFSSTTTGVYATTDSVYVLTSAQLRRVTSTAIQGVDFAYSRVAGHAGKDVFIPLVDKLIYASGAGLGVFGVRADAGPSGFVREQLAPVPMFGGFSTVVSNFVELGGRLYFAVSRQVGPFESKLYSTDGTAAGTAVISSTTVGLPIGIIEQLTVFNGRIYFCGWTPTLGAELYRTDGTPGSVQLVSDINVGAGSSSPQILGDAGGKLYVWVYADSFGNQPLLYSTGEVGPLTRVGDFLAAGVTNENPSRVVDVGGKALFLGVAAFNSNAGREMFITDGTEAGTVILADINPGPSGLNTQTVGPSAVKAGARAVFLAATGDSTTVEMWGTDGTPGGTTRLFDAGTLGYANFSASNAWYLASNGQRAFFPLSTISEGREPWTSDGTVQGTRLLKDINSGLVGASSIPGPPSFLPSGTALFAASTSVSGYEVWGSAGTTQGTQQVSTIGIGSLGTTGVGVSTLGNKGLFIGTSATSGLGLQAYAWGGSGAPGARIISNPNVPVISPNAMLATSQGTYVLMAPRLLLATSGPENLTWLNASGQITSGFSQNYQYGPMARLGSGVIFSGGTFTTGAEPCFAGTTPGSLSVIRDLRVSGSSFPQGFTPLNNGVLFFADAGVGEGSEPFFTDGTSAGTVSLGNLNHGGASSWPMASDNNGITIDLPAVFSGRAYFAASVATQGQTPVTRLVSTDGTLAGTSVHDLGVTPRGSFIAATTQGVFFAAAGSGTTDTELYITDGTPAGTRRVIDLAPGTSSTSFDFLFGAGDRLYFGAAPFGGVRSLYVTDGTAAGTTMLPWPDAGQTLVQLAPGGAYRGRFVFLGRVGSAWTVAETRGTPATTCIISPPVSSVLVSNVGQRPRFEITGSRGFYFGSDTLNLGEPRSVNLCLVDVNNSGTVTIQDVFDYLAAFFAGDPSADYNGVGGVSVQDVFDFVAGWFAGC